VEMSFMVALRSQMDFNTVDRPLISV
jgi:hypothetical protein